MSYICTPPVIAVLNQVQHPRASPVIAGLPRNLHVLQHVIISGLRVNPAMTGGMQPALSR